MWCHLTLIREEHGIQCMPCSTRIISEMQPEVYEMERYDFLKPIIHSQILKYSVVTRVVVWKISVIGIDMP